MKITNLKTQVKNPNRVNVFVDGIYRFSVDALQLSELGLKIGAEFSDSELKAIESEGLYSKLYARSLEYAFVRPRSTREMKEYLYKKTRPVPIKGGGFKEGVPTGLTERVLERLQIKGYVNDKKFAEFWVANRNLKKGMSMRKLKAELQAKGVAGELISEVLGESDRTEIDELRKVYTKKASSYDSSQKLIAYLARQGFSYDAIKTVLAEDDSR